MTHTHTVKVGTRTYTTSPSADPVPPPVPPPVPVYTFLDDFTAPLDPVKWATNYRPSGATVKDATLVSVVNGQLAIKAVRQADGTWRSGSIDTKVTAPGKGFAQKYGRFGARVKVPAGAGFWLGVLWGYDDATGQEIDHEVYANPKGAVAGHDLFTDRCTVHFNGTTESPGAILSGVDLSLAFHDYEYDWRSDRIDWYLDGKLGRTYTGSGIPNVPLPLILDFGIGNSAGIGTPNATTPPQATMLVEKVWVTA